MAGFFAPKNLAIIGLVVVVVGLLAGVIPNPFQPHGSGVDFYYVFADGHTEPIKAGQSFSLFSNGFTIYKDSGYTQEIAGVRGSLWLNPTATGATGNVVIDYTTVSVGSEPYVGVIMSSGPFNSDTIPANTKTSGLKTKEIPTSAFLSFAAEGKYTITWTYTGKGTLSGTTASADWSTAGSIDIYYRKTGTNTYTLTITAGVDYGTFSIVR